MTKRKCFIWTYLVFFLLPIESFAESQKELTKDFDFLLKKITYLEREAQLLHREHLALGGALQGITSQNSSWSELKRKQDSLRDRLELIEGQIQSGEFGNKELKELERKLQQTETNHLIARMESLRLEWQRDDERSINSATDRAYDEMSSYMMYLLGLLTLAGTVVVIFLEQRNKKVVGDRIRTENVNQYKQIFETWSEQKNNAREDAYRTALIYGNLALNVYLTRFLRVEEENKYGTPIQQIGSSISHAQFRSEDLIEAINLLDYAESILSHYETTHVLDFRIPQVLLEHDPELKDKRNQLLAVLEKSDKKITALKAELYLDWAYYIGEFQRTLTLSEMALGTMRDYISRFLRWKSVWLQNEYNRNSENPTNLLKRIAHINDTLTVVQIQTGSVIAKKEDDIAKLVKEKTMKDIDELRFGNVKPLEGIFAELFEGNTRKYASVLRVEE